jgi:hypothetical protein
MDSDNEYNSDEIENSYQLEFIIVADLAVDLIIGMEASTQMNMIIDGGLKHIDLDGNCYSFDWYEKKTVGTVYVIQDTLLKMGKTQKVNINIERLNGYDVNIEGKKFSHGLNVVEGVMNAESKFIYMENCRNCNIKVAKGTIIGKAYAFDPICNILDQKMLEKEYETETLNRYQGF